MKKDNFVIKQAVSFVNESTSELKNVYANKHVKLAALINNFYICEITADQPDENDPTQFETKQYRTTASDIDPESWKIIFEMYGWSNVRSMFLRKEPVQSDLFKYVSNDAITESTIPKARGAQAISYYVEIPFTDTATKVDDKKTFVTQPSYMTAVNFNNFLTKTIDKIQDDLRNAGSTIVIKAPSFGRSKGPGAFKFDQIEKLFSSGLAHSGGFSGSSTGLAQEFAWQIDCRDTVGNQHVFKTVKSDIPAEAYETKLRDVGFTDIRSRMISKPGTLTLADIQLNMQSFRTPDKFEQIESGLSSIQDKFENSNFGKALKTIKRIHDWVKK